VTYTEYGRTILDIHTGKGVKTSPTAPCPRDSTHIPDRPQKSRTCLPPPPSHAAGLHDAAALKEPYPKATTNVVRISPHAIRRREHASSLFPIRLIFSLEVRPEEMDFSTSQFPSRDFKPQPTGDTLMRATRLARSLQPPRAVGRGDVAMISPVSGIQGVNRAAVAPYRF